MRETMILSTCYLKMVTKKPALPEMSDEEILKFTGEVCNISPLTDNSRE
jgi:hypothetical protein